MAFQRFSTAVMITFFLTVISARADSIISVMEPVKLGLEPGGVNSSDIGVNGSVKQW